jgi:hypothetical protein
MPIAVNCLVVPKAMLGLVGETWIEDSIAEVTVSVVLPDLPLNVAVIIVDEPDPTAVARPLEAATVAMAASDEVQVADEVRSWLVLFE